MVSASKDAERQRNNLELEKEKKDREMTENGLAQSSDLGVRME